MSASELDEIDGALTGCAVAIAHTGTIVLDGREIFGSPRDHARCPDHHICIVRAEHIVGLVPEAIARVADGVRAQCTPITLVSGPSATSDIELTRVEASARPSPSDDRDCRLTTSAGRVRERRQSVDADGVHLDLVLLERVRALRGELGLGPAARV